MKLSNYMTLVVDVQDEFLREKPEAEVKRAIKNQKKIIDYSVGQGHEVAHILYDGFGGLSGEYEPNDHKIFKKEDMSVFTSKELVNHLKKTKPDVLVMMGCNGSCCIRDSVDDALSRGYQVIIPENTLA